jgi:hypothetical protein
MDIKLRDITIIGVPPSIRRNRYVVSSEFMMVTNIESLEICIVLHRPVGLSSFEAKYKDSYSIAT